MTAKKKPPIQKTKPKPVFSDGLKPFENLSYELYTTKEALYRAKAYYNKGPFVIENTVCSGITEYVVPKGTKNGIYLLGVFDGRRTTLVHELTHMLIMTFSHYGMYIPDSNGEAFCYQLDHVFSNTVRSFRKD